MRLNEKVVRETIRKGLMDCIILGDFQLQNKIGVLEMVENMPSQEFHKIYESFLVMDTIQIRECLNLLYSNYLIESNSFSMSIGNQNVWETSRNDILIEKKGTGEDIDQENLNKALVKVAMTSSVPVTAAFIFKHHKDNPKALKKAMTHLKNTLPKQYNKIVKMKVIRQILPDQKRAKKIIDDAFQTGAKKINKLDVTLAKMKTAKPGDSILIAIGAIGGVVAVATALQYTYQRFMSKAAKSCKGQKGKAKTICMLHFKIASANEAIKTAQTMMKGCDKKPDPEKCKYSLNQKIWYWNKRKVKYQKKLADLVRKQKSRSAKMSKK